MNFINLLKTLDLPLDLFLQERSTPLNQALSRVFISAAETEQTQSFMHQTASVLIEEIIGHYN